MRNNLKNIKGVEEFDSQNQAIIKLEQEKAGLEKRLFELEKKIEELESADEKNFKYQSLIEINSYISNSLEKEEILRRIFQRVKQLLDCELCSILLVDEEINRLKFGFLSKVEDEEILKDTDLKMGEGIAGTVWRDGLPVIIDNVQTDPRFSNRADKVSHSKTRSIMAVPFIVNGKIIGVIEAINKANGNFNDFDLRILQYVSTQSAIAINNADLYNMAIRDGMTRLFIHKYFKERLAEELSRAMRNSRNLSLVIFDIDHFKKFNDTYGHQAGDKILKEFAELLKKNSRAIDIPCRYGGEEFTVILPETSMDEVMNFTERVRVLAGGLKINYEGEILGLTISGGCVSYPEQKPNSQEEFIEMADIALYHSKENGRNRVSFFKSDMKKISEI